MHDARKVFSRDQVHDKIMRAVGIARVVNGDDVWMRQAGQGLSFAVESLDRLDGLHGLRRQQFDGHLPIEFAMNGPKDAPHSAAAQFVQQLVFADNLELRAVRGGKLIRSA